MEESFVCQGLTEAFDAFKNTVEIQDLKLCRGTKLQKVGRMLAKLEREYLGNGAIQ